MSESIEPGRQFLRHTLATIAYRGGKAVRGVDENVPDFRVNESTRTPLEILAHIGDLFDWALSLVIADQKWSDSKPESWDEEVQRFFEGIKRLETFLESDQEIRCSVERLFQGPLADALTHIGQIAMLRRMAGSPVRGENYYKASITRGRVGPDQEPPRREFD